MYIFCSITMKRLLFSLPGLVLVSGMAFVLTSFVSTPTAYASCLDEQTPCAWVQFYEQGSSSVGIAWWYGSIGSNGPTIHPDFYVVRWAQDGKSAEQVQVDAQGPTGFSVLPGIDPVPFSLTFQVQACQNKGLENTICTDWSDEVVYSATPPQANLCINGYVWRNAYPGDYVCVSLWSRMQAVADNGRAASRMKSGVTGAPNPCIEGYVWRQAGPQDYVCVTPVVRAQTAYDTSQAPLHTLKG